MSKVVTKSECELLIDKLEKHTDNVIFTEIEIAMFDMSIGTYNVGAYSFGLNIKGEEWGLWQPYSDDVNYKDAFELLNCCLEYSRFDGVKTKIRGDGHKFKKEIDLWVKKWEDDGKEIIYKTHNYMIRDPLNTRASMDIEVIINR